VKLKKGKEMRTMWLIMMLLAVVCLAGCSETAKTTATVLVGSNTEMDEGSEEYTVRVGVQSDDVELGIVGSCWSAENSDDGEVYGLYILQSLMDPNGLALVGRPYIAAQGLVTPDTKGRIFGLMAGTVHEIGGVEILSEFEWRPDIDIPDGSEEMDEWKMSVGPRIKF